MNRAQKAKSNLRYAVGFEYKPVSSNTVDGIYNKTNSYQFKGLSGSLPNGLDNEVLTLDYLQEIGLLSGLTTAKRYKNRENLIAKLKEIGAL